MGFLGERVDVSQVPWSRNLRIFCWCCVFFIDTKSYLHLSNSPALNLTLFFLCCFFCGTDLDKPLCTCSEQIPFERTFRQVKRQNRSKPGFISKQYSYWVGKEITAWEERDREQTTIFRSVLCVLHLILIKRFLGELRALRFYRLWQSSPITWRAYSVLCSARLKMQNLSKNGISAPLFPCCALPQVGRTQW